MHGTQGGDSLIYGESGPPVTLYIRLLRSATALDLCRACHGSSPEVTSEGGLTPPKVENNAGQIIVPSAGDFRHNNSANDQNRHNIGGTVPSPPGAGTAVKWTNVQSKFGSTLNCLYCHDQHGNKNYRNLRYNPGDPSLDTEGGGVVVSFSVDSGTDCSDGNTTPCDVKVLTSSSNLFKYKRDSITFFKTSANEYNRISEWCGMCHTKFYGISGDTGDNAIGGTAGSGVGAGDDNTGNPWVRHPVGDVNISSNNHTDLATWDITNTKIRYAEDDPGPPPVDDEQPFCLTCHYAHGGGNPNKDTNPGLDHSMLVFTDDATPAGLPNIDSSYDADTGRMLNTCQECHNQ
jgi:hypothetical protein